MTLPGEESFAVGVRAVVALALALATSACARPLVERAIAARGGPLGTVSRTARVEASLGFPGDWAWRVDYRVPDRLRWTLETYGEEQSVAFDGTTVRYFLGSAALPDGGARLDDFRSLVRWTAVTMLDALSASAQVELRELPAGERPAGAAAALEVRYRADGARYVLAFDGDDRLVAADGPIVVPTIAAGRMHATYGEFAEVAGFVLPRLATYTLDGAPFFTERIERWQPDDPALTASSFAGPPPRRR